MKNEIRTKPTLHYLFKAVMLALAYYVTGRLGLLLAIPPGYATVIWPPSGIALGMLIMHGWRLWPGVLLGSFILNCYISGAYSPDTGFIEGKTIAAFGIAIGSTLQALAGRALVSRFIGIPLTLNSIKEMFELFVLSGPIACLIAATIGIETLYFSGVMPLEAMAGNWLTWWVGDVFGILVFLPLMLVAPGSPNRLIWRGNELGTLPAIAMLTLLVPLGLTFYAWKIASESSYDKGISQFESLASESEKAMLHKLDSYENALLGSEGFIQGSQHVSRSEWHSYVDAIHIERNFPGMNALGLTLPVQPEEILSFERDMRKDGMTDFAIHPSTSDKPYYIISYLEPQTPNKKALGLNIAFEANRLEAANLSRDSGESAITKRIVLAQDDEKTPGFVLMHPIYWQGKPVNTVKERQAAFRGWINGAFIAKNFMKELTQSQGYMLNLKIYDGDKASKDALIYSSGETGTIPAFTKSKQIQVMQQKWLIVWESTPAYELVERSNNTVFIMVGGLLFTFMFGMFLMVTSVRRTETMEWMTDKKGHVLPVVIFLLLTGGAFLFYQTLKEKELYYVKALVAEEANKIELLLATQTSEKLMAIKRMAQRWQIAGGTPQDVWKEDAFNYTQQLHGLKTVEWVDSTFHVRWAEPLRGNERAIGMNIIFDEKRAKALKGAAEKNTPTMTPPLDLVQGYKAFIVYLPIKVHENFDGFIVGVFSIADFFSNVMTKEMENNYDFSMSYEGHAYYDNATTSTLQNSEWSIEKSLQIYDKQWKLQITPTEQLVKSQQTSLPVIALIAGLMIAVLSGLIVWFSLISHLKSSYLKKLNQQINDGTKQLKVSEERYDLVVRGMSVGLWDWNIETGEMYWSKKLNEIFGIIMPDFIPDLVYFSEHLHPEDKEVTLKTLSEHLEHRGSYNVEYRLLRPDGEYVWIHASGQAQWDTNGKPIRMAGSVVDISERIAVSTALNESNSLKSAVLSGAQHMVIATDTTGIIKVFNQAAQSALGYTADEVVGKKTPALWHDMQEIVARAQVLSTELGETIEPGFDVFIRKAQIDGNESSEWTFIRKDGSRFPVNLTATPLKNDIDEITGYLGIIEDITERKEAEQALKTSEQTFRAAMDYAPNGMALVSPDGKWLKVNNSLCNLLGYTEEELLKIDFQTVTHPEDLQKDMEHVHEMLAKKIPSYSMEKRYFHKNGRIIWILLNVSLVWNDDYTPKYFISQIQDITNIKNSEKQREELIEKLVLSNTELERFAYVASHDMQEPLRMIANFSELIGAEYGSKLDAEAQQYVHLVAESATRMQNMVNDLLEYARTGNDAARFITINCNEELKHVLDNLYAAIKEHNAQITYDVLPSIIGNPVQFMRLVQNLIGNGLKYQQKGSIPTIHVSAEEQEGFWLFSIRDNGIGMDEAYMHEVFEPFKRLHTWQEYTGTGIGLAVCKKIAENHGGKIWVTSERGKGSIFYFTMPKSSQEDI